MSISATQVKELRDRTKAGFLDCKKALTEASGNMEDAIKILREKGIAKAGRKSDREAKEGIITSRIGEGYAILFKVSCETDFVSRNDDFQTFVREIGDFLEREKPESLEEALQTHYLEEESLENFIKQKVGKLGENIKLSEYRLFCLKEENVSIASYIHMSGRAGAIVKINKSGAEDVGRDIAMHIVATKPEAIDEESLNPKIIANEKEIFLKQLAESGKPAEILEKIVQGKMRKFFEESCLLRQEFIKNSDISVSQLLETESPGAKILEFALMQIG